MKEQGFRTLSIPPTRALVVDAGTLSSKRHIIYGFLQADVTRIKESRAEATNPLSFTAYLAYYLARAVAEEPSVQAYRHGRNKLIVFEDVDIDIMIEPTEGAVAIPHIVRKANTKTVQEISDEIRSVQKDPAHSPQHSTMRAERIPRWLRMLFFRLTKRNAFWARKTYGTVMLTSVGMFGGAGHGGFGLTFLPLHTIGVTVGGIESKLIQDNHGELQTRQVIDLTIAFDHDIVDGAPAARFAKRLVECIESGVTRDYCEM